MTTANIAQKQKPRPALTGRGAQVRRIQSVGQLWLSVYLSLWRVHRGLFLRVRAIMAFAKCYRCGVRTDVAHGIHSNIAARHGGCVSF
jgi:hypothetical protein